MKLLSITFADTFSLPFNFFIVFQKSLYELFANCCAVLSRIILSLFFLTCLIAQWYLDRANLRKSNSMPEVGFLSLTHSSLQKINLSLYGFTKSFQPGVPLLSLLLVVTF